MTEIPKQLNNCQKKENTYRHSLADFVEMRL